MIDALDDPRRPSTPQVGTERELLEAWLEFHRTTLLLKCEGLTDEQRKAQPIATSLLSLHGLLRHMTDVETCWYRWTLLERTPAEEPPRYWTPDGMDEEFTDLEDASWEDDLAAWHAACDASRRACADLPLDHEVDDDGTPNTLRWIHLHMIEEYARHNGHADLLRELTDGAVGD